MVIGCAVSSLLGYRGKKIDCCALLIRQEMFAFHLQASSTSMCVLQFVCVCVDMTCMPSAEKIDVCMNMKKGVIGKMFL